MKILQHPRLYLLLEWFCSHYSWKSIHDVLLPISEQFCIAELCRNRRSILKPWFTYTGTKAIQYTGHVNWALGWKYMYRYLKFQNLLHSIHILNSSQLANHEIRKYLPEVFVQTERWRSEVCAKNRRQILSHTDRANEVNKTFIIWLLVHFLLCL